METLKQACGATMLSIMTLLLAAPGVNAQAAQPVPEAQTAQTDQDQDPPGRVARLNYIDGSVSFQPDGESDWVDAVLNRPLVTGDNLWSDENSRAELHIGATALRIGEKTGITLLEVSDHAVQIRLAMGSLIVNVRRVDAEDAYEIDTPNVAFVVTQPGDYRVDASPDDYRSDVTVWRGRGEVTGAGSTYTIAAGQVASFTGDDHQDYEVGQAADNDALDAWASERDRREDDSDSGEYVSRDMTGYEDLGSYGDWSYVAEYGYVWHPAGLVEGWAPYRFGRWLWVSPWGWTWVADEKWGFAPFHYGRWAFAGNGWVWVPGSRIVRPVYAPALVGWVGGPVSRRAGSVGWFPLAPGEVFVPGYKVSGTYVNRVNTTNTKVNETRVASVYKSAMGGTGTNNIVYANRNVEGGVSSVSHDTFVNARSVNRNIVPLSAKEIAETPTTNAASLEPSRLSRLGAEGTRHRPPAAMATRAVVGLRTPVAVPAASEPGQTQIQRAQSTSSQALVRQVTPGQRVTLPLLPAKHLQESSTGLHSVEESSSGNAELPMRRVWEEQGTPEAESTVKSRSENKNTSPAQQRTRVTAVKSATPTPTRTPAQPTERPRGREEKPEYSSWHPQKAAANSSGSHASSGHAGFSSSAPPPKK